MADIFTFIKSHSMASPSRYFLTDTSGFREVLAEEIVSCDALLITHDYWMICGELFDETGRLPAKVVDLDEFRIFASRKSDLRREREKHDVIQYINKFSPKHHAVNFQYKKIFYAEIDHEEHIIQKFHQLVLIYYIEVCRWAFQNGEFRRFIEIEMPCQHVSASISARGIAVRTDRINKFRADASHAYYLMLRELSDCFNVSLDMPSVKEIEAFALAKNVDIEMYSSDFIINYLPQIRDFATAVLRLRELDSTRGILNSIAVSSNRVHPIVDTQGSRTSRISVRSPYLQGLAKRYRSILASDPGKHLCYVDFDQFEVGIMAALSRDPELLALYVEPDMYESFRVKYLKGEGERGAAKTLFLAYAYGMKRNHLPLVGLNFGISRSTVKEAFKSFARYENWKVRSIGKFECKGFVSTSFGNRLYREKELATNKEKLSAISQIVQGEGSLIFKKTLLEISHVEDVDMLLPMHDALLFQHGLSETPQRVKGIFERIMTTHFNSEITGKASIEDFCS